MNYIDLLERVYLKDLRNDTFTFRGEDYTSFEIAEGYSLSLSQVYILAYLSHFYPDQIVEDKLFRVVADGNGTLKEEIANLEKRKFIKESKMIDGSACYEMTSDCREALTNCISFGIPLFEDCFSILKTADNRDFVSENWKNRFYQSLSLPNNQRLKDAYQTLKIKSLDEDAQSAFWLLASSFMNRFLQPFSFRGDRVASAVFFGNDMAAKIGIGKLVKAGLAVSLPVDVMDGSLETERYLLSPRAVQAMFHGCDDLVSYDEMSKMTKVVPAKDIVAKQLSFSEETQTEIDKLRIILSVEGFSHAERILKRQRRNPAVQCLLWGPPGTGKTEVVKQIALETGRDILQFDAAKVIASAYGASEKNISNMFLIYKYLVAVCSKTPILLLNECDQILSRRMTNLELSIDRCENSISDIILQEFDEMSGILLATTNLVINVDEAFDRRFLFKTEFQPPDTQARMRIWHSLLPELEEREVAALAEKFEMTGAQINNVVAKRELAELYYDGDRGLEYIIELCETELNGPKIGARIKACNNVFS